MWGILSVVILLGVGTGFVYNQLIRHRNLLREALSGVDVQLKRRYDLIPNLISVVKGYKNYEQELLPEIIRLRSQSLQEQSIKEKGKLESSISCQVKSILFLSEAYPDLKADQNYLKLQNSLIETEDHIQLARRYYNGTVRDYNILAESFPHILIARAFHFFRADFFELEYATERKNPDVKFSS